MAKEENTETENIGVARYIDDPVKREKAQKRIQEEKKKELDKRSKSPLNKFSKKLKKIREKKYDAQNKEQVQIPTDESYSDNVSCNEELDAGIARYIEDPVKRERAVKRIQKENNKNKEKRLKVDLKRILQKIKASDAFIRSKNLRGSLKKILQKVKSSDAVQKIKKIIKVNEALDAKKNASIARYINDDGASGEDGEVTRKNHPKLDVDSASEYFFKQKETNEEKKPDEKKIEIEKVKDVDAGIARYIKDPKKRNKAIRRIKEEEIKEAIPKSSSKYFSKLEKALEIKNPIQRKKAVQKVKDQRDTRNSIIIKEVLLRGLGNADKFLGNSLITIREILKSLAIPICFVVGFYFLLKLVEVGREHFPEFKENVAEEISSASEEIKSYFKNPDNKVESEKDDEGKSRTDLPVASTEITVSDVYKKSTYGVVTIKTSNAQGSGFIISSAGHVVTNWHVVKSDQKEIEVKILGSGISYNAILKGWLEDHDLAILKINSTATFKSLSFTPYANVDVGEKVIVIGTPKGLEGSVTQGIVSMKREDGGVKIIQTDAAINSGNSGGPIISQKTGKVIGVATASVVDTEGINLGVSTDHVTYLMNGLQN